MSDSNSDSYTDLLIARWSDRFIAWLIDFLIISAISTIIFAITLGNLDFAWDENSFFTESTNYIPVSLLFFAYWTISEFKGGQSIGKKILHLRVVNLDGGSPSFVGILISSFGKSFLLPLDVILGLIFTNQKRQRIFNKIGDTIILKIKDEEKKLQNIRYKKD